MVKIVNGISKLIEKYDGFILDQWGVLHNGSIPFPGALEALDKLSASGKRMIILSNSSRRAKDTLNNLRNIGFDEKLFMDAVTGGEACYEALVQKTYGTQCCWFGWRNMDNTYLHDMNLNITSVQSADFILAYGTETFVQSNDLQDMLQTDFPVSADMGPYESYLDIGIARGIPLLCSNPDLISINGNGIVAHMPGKIAQYYASHGGTVHYYGKPNKGHFDACLQKLNLPSSKVVHVGDSMHHDIKGANNANIDSLFIANGVHASHFEINTIDARDFEIQEVDLQNLIQSTNCNPTYASSSFYST